MNDQSMIFSHKTGIVANIIVLRKYLFFGFRGRFD